MQSKKLENYSNNIFFKKKMTKADIVNEITKNTGIDKVTVLATVEALGFVRLKNCIFVLLKKDVCPFGV